MQERALCCVNTLCVYGWFIFTGEADPWGELTPSSLRKKGKERTPGNVFFSFPSLFSLFPTAYISQFREEAVLLTHCQAASQSPFVNRAMFYNSLLLPGMTVSIMQAPTQLSCAMRLFLWFALTVMVIVCQTIYSGDNDHRLQLFLKPRRPGREGSTWLITREDTEAGNLSTHIFAVFYPNSSDTRIIFFPSYFLSLGGSLWCKRLRITPK